MENARVLSWPNSAARANGGSADLVFGKPDFETYFYDAAPGLTRWWRLNWLPSTLRLCRLPMGYETAVWEGGSGLSGGQRQRLALARIGDLPEDPHLG